MPARTQQTIQTPGREKEYMTPKRRFLGGFFGGRVDKTPCGNPTSVATLESMQILQDNGVDAWFPEVHRDGKKMAALAATGHTILGLDTVMPIFGIQLEAAALGATILWGEKGKPDLPAVMPPYPWTSPDEVQVPDNFEELPDMRAALEALEILRHDYGHRVAIIGKAMGPWTLAYHMYGVQDFLLETMTDPDRIHRWMEALLPITIRSVKAQIRAGADVALVADHSTGDLVSWRTYVQFLLPWHKILLKELGCPVMLHCCGKTIDRMPYFVEAGFDAYHFESKNDARQAVSTVAGRMSLAGNINNPDLIYVRGEESVRAIKEKTKYAIEAGVNIVGPECAIPATAPNENVRAIVEARDEWWAEHDSLPKPQLAAAS